MEMILCRDFTKRQPWDLCQRQKVDARRRIDRELTDHKRKVDAQADSIVAEARREVEVCELVIESQKEQLEKVKAELRNEEIRTVLGDIGVASYIIEADKDTSCDCQPSDHDEGVNRLYRVQYMANYKTGYWEITIYNTKSIQVPENRLPIKLVRV